MHRIVGFYLLGVVNSETYEEEKQITRRIRNYKDLPCEAHAGLPSACCTHIPGSPWTHQTAHRLRKSNSRIPSMISGEAIYYFTFPRTSDTNVYFAVGIQSDAML